MFANFSRQTIDLLGTFLIENTEIECWNAEHANYSLIVALPGIIAWEIGVPTLVLIIITMRKKHLHQDENKVVFGFLFNG